MPALRGHHLICLHFFDGEGYDQEFIENLKSVLRKAGHSPAEICSGADEICAKCLHLKDNRCHYDKDAEDDIRAMDSMALSLLHLAPGDETDWSNIRNAIPSIFHEWYGSYCEKCDWIPSCRKNALFQRLLADNP